MLNFKGLNSVVLFFLLVSFLLLISTFSASASAVSLDPPSRPDSCPNTVNQRYDIGFVDQQINHPNVFLRSINTRIYYPTDANATSPVYLHGAGASNDPADYDFLGAELAREGIVTVLFSTKEAKNIANVALGCALSWTIVVFASCVQKALSSNMISDTEGLIAQLPLIESLIPGNLARDASSGTGFRVGIGGHSAGGMNALTAIGYEWKLGIFGSVKKEIDAHAFVPMDFHTEPLFNSGSTYAFNTSKPVLFMSSGLGPNSVNLNGTFAPPPLYGVPIERLIPTSHNMFYKQTRAESAVQNNEYLYVLPRIDHGDFTSKTITAEDQTIANITAAFLTEYLECEAPQSSAAQIASRQYIHGIATEVAGHVYPNHALVDQCAAMLPQPLSKSEIATPTSGGALESWLGGCASTIYNY